jgi:hypothetical protein
MTWAGILAPLGWQQVRPPDAAAVEAWKRPGGTHPVSAKVLKAAPYVLVNWSEDSGLPVGAGRNSPWRGYWPTSTTAVTRAH